MRIPILLGVMLAVVPVSAGEAGTGCGSTLPAGPAGLPAPVVLRTACGTYRVGADGAVRRSGPVRSPWEGRRPRFRIDVRERHVVVLDHGKVRWRSRRAFGSPSSDLDSVAFSPRAVAFSFLHGRLWVSRLAGREHEAGWGEGALTWTKGGDLLTLRRRHGVSQLVVRDRNGGQPRLVASRVSNFLVDEAARDVVYVTASSSLVRTDGRSQRRLASLRALGFAGRPTLQVLPRGIVAISSAERLVLLRGDGSVFASMDYPAAPPGATHGWATLALGHDRVAVAVELSSRKGIVGEDVFVLRAGTRAGDHVAREQSNWSGCGWMVTMAWHDDWLLYSDTVVDVLAIDTAGGRRIDLSPTARQLPGVRIDDSSGEYAGVDFAFWG